MGDAWKMPSMDAFVDSLTYDQDKIVEMGSLGSSKVHELAENENYTIKCKKKFKGKKDPNPKKDSFHKSSRETFDPKRGKSTKNKVICGYWNRGFHAKHAYMKNTIEQMAHILQHNNLGGQVLENSWKKEVENPSDDKGKWWNGHASSNIWIFDSWAYDHMAATKYSFIFLEPCTGPPILMGDDTPN